MQIMHSSMPLVSPRAAAGSMTPRGMNEALTPRSPRGSGRPSRRGADEKPPPRPLSSRSVSSSSRPSSSHAVVARAGALKAGGVAGGSGADWLQPAVDAAKMGGSAGSSPSTAWLRSSIGCAVVTALCHQSCRALDASTPSPSPLPKQVLTLPSELPGQDDLGDDHDGNDSTCCLSS